MARTQYTPLSPAWEAILAILDNPEDDGGEPEDTQGIIDVLSGK